MNTLILSGMITNNFSWEEAVHTSHRSIDNTPNNDGVRYNIIHTAEVMEKVRAVINGMPIVISSWYRCPKLNAAVGGAKNSDHMTGSAVDFVSPKYGNPLSICKAIIATHALIGFKQLILEHSWVHISFSHIPNTQPKLEVLSLLSDGGYARGLTDRFGVAYK